MTASANCDRTPPHQLLRSHDPRIATRQLRRGHGADHSHNGPLGTCGLGVPGWSTHTSGGTSRIGGRDRTTWRSGPISAACSARARSRSTIARSTCASSKIERATRRPPQVPAPRQVLRDWPGHQQQSQRRQPQSKPEHSPILLRPLDLDIFRRDLAGHAAASPVGAHGSGSSTPPVGAAPAVCSPGAGG
jgi:hypothetical protein